MSQERERVCGGCSACCKTHAVKEIEKSAGVMCQFFKKGVGCTIYSNRPDGCKAFRCEWLKGFGTEEDRPDRRGIVFDLMRAVGGPPEGVLQLFEVKLGALTLTDPFVASLLTAALKRGVYVSFFPLQGRRSLSVPPLTAEEEKHIKALSIEEGFDAYFARGILA